MRSLCVLLPIRSGSQRVPDKNMRPFGSYEGGLTELKLRQLLMLEECDEILIDTDEPRVELLLDRLGDEGLDLGKIRLEPRDPEFARSETTTDALIEYLVSKIQTDEVLWTHVTSPFVTGTLYAEAIAQYYDLDPNVFDSLMSVTQLQEFIWDQTGAVNYDYHKEKWPRTQTLPQWYFINSGIFIYSKKMMAETKNRIGSSPYLFEMNRIDSFDVDWQDDFEIAEAIAHGRDCL